MSMLLIFNFLPFQCAASPSSATTPKPDPDPNDGEDNDSDPESDFEIIPETDSDRRRAMLESGSGSSDDAGNTKLKDTTLKDYWDDFIIPKASSSTSGSQSKAKGKDTRKDDGLKQSTLGGGVVPDKDDGKAKGGAKNGRGLALGNIVQDEVDYRKKEALGMTKEQSEGRKLGGRLRSVAAVDAASDSARPQTVGRASSRWACLVCTL